MSLGRYSVVLALFAACNCNNSKSDGAPADAGSSAVTPTPSTSATNANDGSTNPPPSNDGGGSPLDAGSDANVTVDLAPYRITGRTDSRDSGGPRFGWSGTQIRAKFSGATIAADLSDTGSNDQYDVSIDGAPPTLLVVSGARKSYSFATGLAAGDHELVLTKRTESSVGVTQLFAINGTLTGTPAWTGRRIEMVGDSITAGYGVLGTFPCPFSADTETETLAYGALAAAQLNAAHTAIAWSGIGLYRNFDLSTTETMPDRYSRALASDATSVWPPASFEPDAIVINLGTNDYAGAQSDPGPIFQSTLVTFLTTVRTAHPNAKIVLATSPMLSGDHHAALLAYFNGAAAARNDSNLSVLDLDQPLPADGLGCDSHPSPATHQKMAAKLVTHLKSVMGW